jgi:HlyD family secretion protein
VKPVPYAVRVRRKIIPLITSVGLLVGGYFGYRWYKGEPTPLTYTTQAVSRGDVIQAVTASGTLSPVVKVDVGSQVSGRIQELLVDYNDKVTAGQVIARIDPETVKSAVQQANARVVSARADLAKAKATAANAKLEYERAVELGKTGAISRSDIDAAQLAARSAEASVTSAQSNIVESQASLDQAKTNLTYTTIKSPIDGIVISRAVNVGQTVAASLSAPTLFTIAGDLKQMEVHTSVAESDVGQLTEGMRVEFTVDAFPDDTFTGTVKQVRFEATTVSNVVTYDAVVDVANDQLKLRPGMTANVTFVVAEAQDVLTVSAKALRYRPANAESLLYQLGEGSSADGERGSGEWKGRRRRDESGGAASAQGSGSAGSAAGSASVAQGSGSAAGSADGSAGVGEQIQPAGENPTPAPRGERRGGRNRRFQVAWVLRDGKPFPVRANAGLTDGNVVEIKGGDLKEGDLVITADSSAKTTGSAPAGGGALGGQRSGRRGGGSRGPF